MMGAAQRTLVTERKRCIGAQDERMLNAEKCILI